MELTIYNPTADGFVKEISWNHEELKAEVALKLEQYKGLVYSEDQIKEAKADKAKLNKFLEALESKRKEIKKQCLAPYESFEKQIKEITALINEPIKLIDVQIKEYEQIQKEKKQEEILKIFSELNSFEWLDFELINDPKWLNVTVSLSKIKTEITEKLQKISDELKIIAQIPEYSFEATEVYKSCLNLLKATNEAQRMSDIAKAKAEAERKRQEEEFAKQMTPPVEDAPLAGQIAFTDSQSFDHIVEDSKIEREWISFSAYMTVNDAIALKDFFNQRGIDFKKA